MQLLRAVRPVLHQSQAPALLIEQGGHVSRLPIESWIASFQVLQLPKTDRIGTCISGRRHAFTTPPVYQSVPYCLMTPTARNSRPARLCLPQQPEEAVSFITCGLERAP